MRLKPNSNVVRRLTREGSAAATAGWKSVEDLSPAPVSVSSVVDPSAAVTDPGNGDFRPRNRVELKTAMSSMIDDISDDCAEEIFNAMKKAIDDVAEDKDKDKEMKSKEDKKVEESIRLTVRKMLREAAGGYRDTGLSYSGPGTGRRAAPEGFESCDACEGEGDLDDGSTCKACKGKGYVKSSKRGYRKGSAGLADIGTELGVGTSRARDMIEDALEHFKGRWGIDPDELEILILSGINDYINFLQKSGELSPSDVQLLKDHPKILWSMEGAQEHVGKFINKSVQGGTLIDPLE